MRGGPRPGSGRKNGSLNKRTLAQRRAAEASIEAGKKTGMLPHEMLLAIAQGRAQEVLGCEVTAEERIDCAKAAAPFYAPRLLAMAVKQTTTDNPFEEMLRLVDGGSRGLPGSYKVLKLVPKSETKSKSNDEVRS